MDLPEVVNRATVDDMGTFIPAIETRYAGCRFRSRLEARWAVFFDALGIEWEYEPEGFETPYGGYLPDFYLPGQVGQIPSWIEIRGLRPSRDILYREAWFANRLPEENRLDWFRGELVTIARTQYVILHGDVPRPDRGTWHAICGLRLGTPGWPDDQFDPARTDWLESGFLVASDPGMTARALTAARSARFERGEQPILS